MSAPGRKRSAPSVSTFMISFVRCSVAGDEHVEGAEDRVAAVARDLHDVLELPAQRRKRCAWSELVIASSSGLREREEHPAMRDERPPQAVRSASAARRGSQISVSASSAATCMARSSNSSSVELDRLELLEVRLEHPGEQVGEELRAVEPPDVAGGRRHPLPELVAAPRSACRARSRIQCSRDEAVDLHGAAACPFTFVGANAVTCR